MFAARKSILFAITTIAIVAITFSPIAHATQDDAAPDEPAPRRLRTETLGLLKYKSGYGGGGGGYGGGGGGYGGGGGGYSGGGGGYSGGGGGYGGGGRSYGFGGVGGGYSGGGGGGGYRG